MIPELNFSDKKNNMQKKAKIGIGVIGCGDISGQYIRNMQAMDGLNVRFVADIDQAKARAAAETYGLRAVDLEAILADPEIQIIVNITNPDSHFDISLQVIEAKKAIYSEKPLATSLESVRFLLDLAEKKGVLVGSAPDNFLGPSLQTVRKLISDGKIGEIEGAAAFIATYRPESFHPNPQYLFEKGGGPLFDLAPYCLASLTVLLGQTTRVTGSVNALITKRIIQSGRLEGTLIKPDVPTHVNAVLDYKSGAMASMGVSFDMWASGQPLLEIFGSEGTISLPGPHKFSSPVRVRCAGDKEWSEIPLQKIEPAGRGLGVLDLANAIQKGTQPIASGALAYHLLEIMQAIQTSSESEKHVAVHSKNPLLNTTLK